MCKVWGTKTLIDVHRVMDNYLHTTNILSCLQGKRLMRKALKSVLIIKAQTFCGLKQIAVIATEQSGVKSKYSNRTVTENLKSEQNF